MRTRTLDSILTEHIKDVEVPIDLLCIDVEGHDFEVLSSIDLDKWKPFLIVVEIHDFSISDCSNHKNIKLLTEKGYSLEYFVLSSCYFIRL